MLSVAVIALCLILFYLFWKACCSDKKKDDYQENFREQVRQQTVTPALFAQEIEPGIVVLQNQDGDIFRVLYEYDAIKNNQPGNNPTPGQRSTLHYIPQYTRVHYQTQPSAPPFIPEQNANLMDLNMGGYQQTYTPLPPPYSQSAVPLTH